MRCVKEDTSHSLFKVYISNTSFDIYTDANRTKRETLQYPIQDHVTLPDRGDVPGINIQDSSFSSDHQSSDGHGQGAWQ